MNQLRRTPRFRVEPSFPLKVYIPQSFGKSHTLRTLGEGGLGFFASSKDASLVRQPEIDIQFNLGGRTLALRGSVQYCTFLPRQGSNYFGVMFLDLDPRQELILKTVIQAAIKNGHLVDAAELPRG
jgi:hypothetical protein